jgi:replication factor C subunit 1
LIALLSIEELAAALRVKLFNQRLFIYLCSELHSFITNAASLPSYSPSNQAKPKKAATAQSNLTWTEKHRPKNPKDIIGNQSLV